MRVLFVSLIAVTGCASSRTATTKAPASATSYPAKLYAGLFVKGARHTYTAESKRSHWDDQDPRADPHGNVEETFAGSISCTVTEVRELPSAIASRIECDDPSGVLIVGDAPAGIYVATADGLWSVPEMPRVAPTSTKYRLFAWPPVAADIQEPDPKNPGWGTTTTISQNGALWCRYFTFIAGDDGDEQICVGDGIVVSGSASSAGGSSYEMSYSLAKT
ncbi:MAG: hypothetical protein HOV81_28895 [Kofleriaceae bacterium]|nr:hypothetical protein [Kofleriaceae bacterium]